MAGNNLESYYLSSKAILNLEEIYLYSLENFGKTTANKYVQQLYKDFAKIANNPEYGNIRISRSFPFRIYPSGKHFIIFDIYKKVIILTIQHQTRNIEKIIKSLDIQTLIELEEIKQKLPYQ